MRVALLVGLTLALAALPYACGVRVLRVGGPRTSVFLALVALLGLSTSVLFTLAALLDPSDLPARSLPDIVSRCLDATTTILSHPVTHWPRIVGAILLATLLTRAAYGVLVTLRTSSRGMPQADAAHRELLTTGISDPVIVVDDQRMLAYTVGLLRPRVVVSEGLLAKLHSSEVQAVLAHEEAHASGRHTALLFLGRSADRAFGFLPPIRRAVDQLTLGLEVIADDRATDRVGDPMIVAHALASFATVPDAPHSIALGAAENEVVFRVRRLGARARSGSGSRSRLAAWAFVCLGTVLFLGQLFALPASSALNPRTEARQLHSVCHLPHGADSS